MVNQIKQSVGIIDICNRYGVNIDKTGKCLCPFHTDKHPSVKIYKKTDSFYCFVCAKGGDAVSFVQGLFDIDFKSAIAKINEDFNLGVKLYSKASKIDLKRISEQRLKKQQEELQKELEFNKLLDEHRKYYNYYIKYTPKTLEEMDNINELYIIACYWLPILDEKIRIKLEEF